MAKWLLIVSSGIVIAGCGGSTDSVLDEHGNDIVCRNDDGSLALENLPYAQSVVSFEPGDGASFGHDAMPGIVLGPPNTPAGGGGSLDVVSLGIGGEITLSFGSRTIVNGPGPDFVIFENAFAVGGDPANPFAELGRVSVSVDGQTWHEFECDPSGTEAPWPGCAGWRIAVHYETCDVLPLDPDVIGGDPFDLDRLGLSEARYVRVTDLSTKGSPPTAGFDLDAVGLVNWK